MRTIAELTIFIKVFPLIKYSVTARTVQWAHTSSQPHVQCTGHTSAVSPTYSALGTHEQSAPRPQGLSGHFPPYSTNRETTLLPAHVTQTVLLSPLDVRVQNASLQSVLPFSCLHHNQLHYVQRNDTAGPVESLTAPHKRAGYCKQAGGVTAAVRSAVNCLSERKHKCEGRHPTVP